ncbi:MAG: polyphenol oxidase family protein [Planctomycetota bacterium]|nr:polyphenol oxidase family protein [Planctomycetota bacterium]
MINPRPNLSGLQAPSLEKYGFRLTLTGRNEGNLALHIPCDTSQVIQARQRVLERLGLSLANIAIAQQVHSARVALIGPSHAGAGGMQASSAIPNVDGLITSSGGPTLMAFSADCPLIAIVHPETGSRALLHSGRLGTLHEISIQAVLHLQKITLGNPESFHAIIGPGICRDCYPLGQDTAQEFIDSRWSNHLHQTRSDPPKLDLRACIRNQLQFVGIPDNKIEMLGPCTSCRNDLFFSYRADGPQTGRFAAILQSL